MSGSLIPFLLPWVFMVVDRGFASDAFALLFPSCLARACRQGWPTHARVRWTSSARRTSFSFIHLSIASCHPDPPVNA